MNSIRHCTRSAFALVLLGGISGSAYAQNAAVDLYGKGVHSYFAGRYSQAIGEFTAAIDAGSKDPRVYYFRGLAEMQSGQSMLGEADLQKGAVIESTESSAAYPVAKSLERVQGSNRMTLERIRNQAKSDVAAGRQPSFTVNYTGPMMNMAPVVRIPATLPAPVPTPVAPNSRVVTPPAVPTPPTPAPRATTTVPAPRATQAAGTLPVPPAAPPAPVAGSAMPVAAAEVDPFAEPDDADEAAEGSDNPVNDVAQEADEARSATGNAAEMVEQQGVEAQNAIQGADEKMEELSPPPVDDAFGDPPAAAAADEEAASGDNEGEAAADPFGDE